MARLLLLVLLVCPSGISLAESLRIEPKHATFAPEVAASTVRQSYTISNQGTRSVAIREWKAISGVGSVVGLPKELQPGESRNFEVQLPLPTALGQSGFRFALLSDETDVERYRFTLSGFVYSLISPELPTIDFGNQPARQGEHRQISFSARESLPLQLIHVETSPDWLNAVIEGQSVTLTMQKADQSGFKAGKVRISTNLPQQPAIEISVRAIVGGALTSNIYALGFKPVEVGQQVAADLEFRYSGKTDLKLLEAELPDGWTSTRASCTGQAEAASKCVRMHVSRRLDKPGRETGTLAFRMPGEDTLEIPFGTVALGKGQPIRELLLGESEPEEPIDIIREVTRAKGAVQSAAAPKPESAPADNVARSTGPGPVKLHWKAANEDKVFGYMVYRSLDRAGPFVRVSPSPITNVPSNRTQDGSYKFTDSAVESGKTYYYYIDSMATNGVQQRFSPVLSKSVTAGVQNPG